MSMFSRKPKKKQPRRFLFWPVELECRNSLGIAAAIITHFTDLPPRQAAQWAKEIFEACDELILEDINRGVDE